MTDSPHVAVLPSPGMGHVIPLLELAKNLVIHHNLKVSFLFITSEASPAQIELLRSPSLPSGLQVVDLPLVDISKIAHDDMTIVARLSIIVQESLRTLDQVLIDLHYPKAVIIDMFCTDAIQICKKLSIPVYSFFTASTALLAFSLYLPTLDRDVECEYGELLEPIQMPGCSPIRTEDLPDQVQNRKIDEYKWYLLHVSRLPQAVGIFVNSWESIEPVSLSALRNNSFFKKILINSSIHPVGPLIKKKEPITESDGECLKWLDDQPSDSVLFVSLGSGGTLTADQLTEMAWGLELSQQRFILVVRKPTDASGSGAFFNAGGSGEDNPISYLPEGFVKRTERFGLVIPSWAPQVAVLSHQSTGGFLSHCGWNSSLESIAHGVPIITWPLYAEQRMNAAMLSKEIGVAVRPVGVSGKGVVGREEIERVVRLLMEGDEGKVMRHKVRELQRSSEKALAIGGASYNSLTMVAGAWKANTNNKIEGS